MRSLSPIGVCRVHRNLICHAHSCLGKPHAAVLRSGLFRILFNTRRNAPEKVVDAGHGALGFGLRLDMESWTDAMISEAVSAVTDRITELVLQVAALPAILEERGISRADVETRVTEFRRKHTEKAEQAAREWHEKQVQEQIRRLLEDYEGTVQ